MVTDLRPVQSENALAWIAAALSGMMTEVRLVQPEKEVCPKNLRPSEKTTDSKFTHPSKAIYPIEVTEEGIVREVSPDPLNAASSMLETVSDSVTEVRPVQPENV